MHSIDTLEFVLAERGPAGLQAVSGLSAVEAPLSTAIEIAAVRWGRWRETGEDIAPALPLHSAIAEWGTLLSAQSGSALFSLLGVQVGPAAFPAVADGEVCDVPADRKEWEAGRPFILFQERFKTALRQHGVPSELAHALLGAFSEMASNAAEHAAAPIPAVASFQTSPDRWCFSVTDVGCGVVESLRRNPAYATVPDARTALPLALQHGVSGTGKPGRGTGFTTLFKALIDRRCTVRFRSAGVAAACTATSPTAATLAFLVLPPRTGFHVAVTGDYPQK